MKNYINRIKNIEQDYRKIFDANSPCYAFVIRKQDVSDRMIMDALNKYEGLDLTLKEFAKWKKEKIQNHLLVLSPNFEIGKYILQHKKSTEISKQYKGKE